MYRYFLIFFLGLLPCKLLSQSEVMVRYNSLFLPAPNLGVEYIFKQQSFLLDVMYSPWKFNDGSRYKFLYLSPEYRFYKKSPVSKTSFIGAQVSASQYYTRFGANNNLFDGYFVGTGFVFGFRKPISNRLFFEFSSSIGYTYFWFDKMYGTNCISATEKGSFHYLGVNKLGITFTYRL